MERLPGNVYLADYDIIRMITPAGVVSTLAGLAGTPGSTDGLGSAARFFNPAGVSIDSTGQLYVADAGNDTIRIMSPEFLPVITSVLTTGGALGTVFTYTITATNSPTSFNASSLPAGLTIDTNTGAISGMPTATGSFNVTINATNTAGTGTAILVITVTADGSGGFGNGSYKASLSTGRSRSSISIKAKNYSLYNLFNGLSIRDKDIGTATALITIAAIKLGTPIVLTSNANSILYKVAVNKRSSVATARGKGFLATSNNSKSMLTLKLDISNAVSLLPTTSKGKPTLIGLTGFKFIIKTAMFTGSVDSHGKVSSP